MAFGPRANVIKKFGHLLIYVKSQSVCPLQAFPAQYNKHLGLLQKIVNYGQKGFITLGPSVYAESYQPLQLWQKRRSFVLDNISKQHQPALKLKVQLYGQPHREPLALNKSAELGKKCMAVTNTLAYFLRESTTKLEITIFQLDSVTISCVIFILFKLV